MFDEVREEAMDFGAHISKGPSFPEYTLCIGADPCQKCKATILERQAVNPAWHPRAVLAPLAFNNYRMPWPVEEEKS